MDIWLLGGMLALAVMDWVATGQNWLRVRAVTKPGAMLLLTIWFFRAAGTQGPALAFGLGLVLSLLGDIFLSIPRNWFLASLLTFLTAHVLYIISFHPTLPLLNPISTTLIFILLAWALVFYRVIRTGLAKIPGNRRLRIGVGIYSLVITLMLLSAILTLFRPDWSLVHAGLVTGGAILFFLSDSLLAYERFVRNVRYSRVAVMVTYHLGQLLLAVGMVLHLVEKT